MILFLFTLAIISSGLSAPIYKQLSIRNANKCETALMPILWFAPLSVVFCIAALIGDGFNAEELFPAMLSGFGSAIAVYMLIESFKNKSYTLAVILINLNFYIPIVLSLIFLGEKATLLQLFGILALTAAIVIINTGKGTKNDEKTNIWSLAKPLMACIANGIVNFGIKLRQYYLPGTDGYGFFSLCYLFGITFCVIIFLYNYTYNFHNTLNIDVQRNQINKVIIPSVILVFITGVCYLSISMLSEYVNAATEFTVITTLSILLSLIVGWIKYKEKLDVKNMLTILCFLCAVAVHFISH